MVVMREKNLSMMIQGHEIWLEKSRHENADIELALVYGHNMRQDGIADAKRLKAFVYSADETKADLDMIPDMIRYLLRFKAEKEGYYTVVVDMGSIIFSQTKDGYEVGPRSQFKDVIYAGAFHQMAEIICQVGNAGEFHGKIMHGILEIVPKKSWCAVGQEIELQIFYEGRPLPGEEVKAVSKTEGKWIALVKTDEQGFASIPVNKAGEWMFLVRHRDATKRVSDVFDESVFVTTLVLEAR